MTEATYERVARAIREGLGEPGSLLPSEAELGAEYRVSRNTVRRALAALEAEGLITSGQGARRQVRAMERWCWPMHSWESSEHHSAAEDAWAASIRGQGGEPSTSVSVQMVEATEHIAKSLEVEQGSLVVVRERVRSVNGEPHQLQASYFPEWLTSEHRIFLHPGDVSAPGGLLAASGLPQVRLYDSIAARMPEPEEARILHMGPGTPLLVHQRTGYDAQGRPVRHMITRVAADRVEVSYALDVQE